MLLARNFKKVLFLYLVFAALLVLPVQSQAPTPTPAPGTANCGLPTVPTEWTSSTSQTVWNMTADCVIPPWSTGIRYIQVTSGDFTINGNGYTIRGPRDNWIVTATGSTAILRLNNVTIEGDGVSVGVPVRVTRGGTLYATNVIIRNHQPVQPSGLAAMWVDRGGPSFTTRAYLTNVAFYNNNTGPRVTASNDRGTALMAWNADEVTINGGIFGGNRGHDAVVRVKGGTLRLRGCIQFGSNYKANGEPAVDISQTSGTTLDDQRTPCPPEPKKKAKAATPTPTATPRPDYGASYTALQTATGMVFQATYGLESGVHFRLLDGAGIGVQALADNYILAVDVYGYVEQGVEVCFPQAGRLFFLDARFSPRAMALLTSTVVDGMTCAAIDTPGSIVLLPPE